MPASPQMAADFARESSRIRRQIERVVVGRPPALEILGQIVVRIAIAVRVDHPDLLGPDAVAQLAEDAKLITDPVDTPVLSNDRAAPFRRNDPFDRHPVPRHNPASGFEGPLDPVQRPKHGLMHGIVRTKFQNRKKLRQDSSIVTGVGSTHNLVDAPFERALRPMLLDDRRKLFLARYRKDHIADPATRRLDRGTRDIDQQPLLAVNLLDVTRDAGHHLALRTHPDLVDGLHQQVDHAVDDLCFPHHQENGMEAQLPSRGVAAHLRCFFGADPPNDLIDPGLAGSGYKIPRQIQLLDEGKPISQGKHIVQRCCTRVSFDRMEPGRAIWIGQRCFH